ncbi:MAG TPA: B12-binding domain-containing radical SAM protein [Candidatus Binatia bacterium]|nr:B12-binding domain-containing radical SAM protein [Candidatus Binatia bacterium]
MNILMLYPKFPDQTFWNSARSVQLLWGRKAIMPPLGLLTIASYLPEDFSVRLIDRNVGEETDADWAWADVVFLSVMMAQRDDYRRCVANAKLRGKPIAVGGPFTHALPEEACADADWACFGEAETIMEQLTADLRADRRGRQYHGGSATDMELAKVPRFELLPRINDYATMALQFSRGCPFKCEFCDIIEIYGRVPRTKTPAQLCAELNVVERLGFQGYIFLVDDNFIGNKRRAKTLLAELCSWNRDHRYPFRYYTEASINLADDEELLERMAAADFFHVFIGIETPEPKLLKRAQKLQNIPGSQLAKLAKIRRHGLHITAGFILGFDGEEHGIFDAQRQFIQASGIGVAMAGLLQAIPHTQLWRRLKAQGRLLESLSSTGNHTVEGINFVPDGRISKREYLEQYRDLIGEIFAPKVYFERTLSGLLELQARVRFAALRRHAIVLLAVLLKELYHFGLRSKAFRFHFWRALFQILSKRPAALEAFVFDCAVFHHLHEHAAYIQDALAQYLTKPAAGDVLDRLMDENSRAASKPAHHDLSFRSGSSLIKPD